MFRARTALLATGSCLALLAAAPASYATTSGADLRAAVQRGADYLEDQQAADGTFQPSTFGGPTSYSAIAAAGRHPADTAVPAGTDAQTGLFNLLTTPGFTAPTNPNGDSAGRVGQIQRGILESEAAGIDSRRVAANQNLVAQLAGYYNGGYFSIAPTTANPERRSTNFAAFGSLALTRVGAPRFLLDQSVRVLRANQHNDGGWNFPLAITDTARAGGSDVDMTGATLAALCETGLTTNDPAVRGGVNFLKSTLNADGAFDGGFPNVSSNAWAVSGLNKCGIDPQGTDYTSSAGNTPIDYIVSQQNADGGFFSAYSGDPGTPIDSDTYSTQDALRPLAGEAFSAEPPARVDPALSRKRTVPAVADGTTVPVALAVDNGARGITFCRVNVPNGASLATLLANANTSSTPGGCATGGEFTGGQVSKLNGQTGTWAYSTNGDAEEIAAGQAVRFGDFVALRRTSGAVPATPGGGPAPAPVPAAQQAKTTPTGVASKSLKASRRKRVVSVSLTCAKGNRLCQGVVYLVYKKRTLARRAFLIAGGKTTKLNVKLSKGAMKRLGKSKKKVKVNVFSRDGEGIASNSTRTVTLTPTK